MSNLKVTKIFQWGPPVFVYNLSKELLNSLRDIKPDIEFTQGKNGKFSGVEIINSRLGYTQDNADRVCRLLSPYFKNYIEDILYKELKYEVNGLWVNLYKANHYIAPHVHTDCDISFIVYIKSNQSLISNDGNPNAGNTVFQYGVAQDSRAIIPSITNIHHKPQDGELIIFPNNLSHHSIPFNNPNITRYTLSGNLKLDI